MTPDPTLSDTALLALLQRACTQLPDAPPELLRAALDLWPSSASSPATGAPTAEEAAAAPLALAAPGRRGLQGVVGAAIGAAGSALRPVLAELRFDSWARSPMAAGLRGNAQAPQQLLFKAADHDIDVRIVPHAPGLWLLEGQVLGSQTSAVLSLFPTLPRPEDPLPRACALDDMGEFHLDAVPSGQWTLRLALAGRLIELPTISLGHADP
jgi:hypothetical protein